MKKVIIIGSGMGGLLAGNLLAKKGHRVTIFEAHSAPGGYTAGFWRKGHYFESGTLSFESSSSIFKAMKEIGVRDKIEFVRQKTRWVSADFSGAPETYDDFKNLIAAAYPNEKNRLDSYFSEVDKMVRAFKPLMAAKPSPFSMLSAGIRLMLMYRKYGKIPVGDFTDTYFPRDSLLNRFFRNIGYPDMATWILGGAIVTLFDDYWTVKNGMQSWADVMAAQFKQSGGELLLNTPVEKILTKDGQAIGVACKDKSYEADYIISASDYKKTFLKLLDSQSSLPFALLDKIKTSAVSEGIFTVYLGLKLSQERLNTYLKAPHVLYFVDAPGFDIHNSDDAGYFKKASIVLYSPTLMNPELSPAGKSSLMLQVVTPYHWMNNWGGGDRQEYRRLKDEAKRAVMKTATRVIPELMDMIEFEDAATPLTYERYTQNTDGATSAWSWNPKNKFYKNFNGSFVETPIKNLLIGSCWANQIGGVPGALGAAYKCVKKIGG
ncbi:MAG: phytoene desaturase family protein [Candidatus Zhuqueibacterota bacterium]